MEFKNIAVVGPGGNVGKQIIQHLLQDGHFQVTAVNRSTSTYTAPDPRIVTVAADFADASSLEKAFANQDAVLCCIPGIQVQFGPQKLLIDAAIAAGVKMYFASEFGGDITSPAYAALPAVAVGDKIRVRKYLEEQAAAGKIAWTALNGGSFFDMWLLGGHAGFDIKAKTAKIYGTGNNLTCWTPLSMATAAMFNMVRNPERIKNRPIFICGVTPGVTQNTLLEALEAELGVKFAVEHVDIKKIGEGARAALAKGDYRAVLGLALAQQFDEEGSTANFWHLVENELVGVEPVTVREAVKMALQSLEKK